MSGLNLDQLELEDDDQGIDTSSMPALDLGDAEPAAVVHAQVEPVIAPLAELLPADFPLPALIRFVPSAALKAELEQAVDHTGKLVVAEQGNEGLAAADLALANLNAVIKKVTEHFAEPADIANRLHKSITSTRAEWCEPAERAKKAIGNAMYTERQRLDAIAREQRRREQEAADKKAREEAEARAAEAKKNQAPPAVVEKLEQEAKTATAPPVPVAPPPAAAMKSSTTVTTWKARIKGTPPDADPNPEIKELTDIQMQQVRAMLRDILDGKTPIAAIELNWSYLNSRAKSDKSTLAITGIEAYAEGSVRSKGTRGR